MNGIQNLAAHGNLTSAAVGVRIDPVDFLCDIKYRYWAPILHEQTFGVSAIRFDSESTSAFPYKAAFTYHIS